MEDLDILRSLIAKAIDAATREDHYGALQFSLKAKSVLDRILEKNHIVPNTHKTFAGHEYIINSVVYSGEFSGDGYGFTQFIQVPILRKENDDGVNNS